MHSTRKIILFLLFLSFARSSFAQPGTILDTDLKALVDSNIALLRSDPTVPVIIYYNSFRPSIMFEKDSLIGIGPRDIEEIIYLIYVKDSKTFITKFISYDSLTDKDRSNYKIAKSQELRLPYDTLLSWVMANSSKLKHDRLLPYIYKSENNGMITYDEGMQMHLPWHQIGIYTSDDFFFNSVYENDMYEILPIFNFDSTRDPNINLNYKYNSGTPLYKLTSALKKLIETSDSGFIFHQ